jgi:hypothetical protein
MGERVDQLERKDGWVRNVERVDERMDGHITECDGWCGAEWTAEFLIFWLPGFLGGWMYGWMSGCMR